MMKKINHVCRHGGAEELSDLSANFMVIKSPTQGYF